MIRKYKFPKFYENLNKLLNKCLALTISHKEVMAAIEQRHLVLVWDTEDEDGVPENLHLAAMVGVAYHGAEVEYEADWCLCTDQISRTTFKHVAVIPDKECPKVFVRDSSSQNIGLLVGVNRVDEDDPSKDLFIVRVPPFVEGYNVKQVSGDCLCLLDDIKLGITEDVENAG